MDAFTIYPAIDLRHGQVVRLQQGDPDRQTRYANNPADIARRWLEAGARWLHVVNLDAAFGDADTANRLAISSIVRATEEYKARVQLGGGIRSLELVEKYHQAGVARMVFGTLAVEQPQLLAECLSRLGAEKIAAGVDAREGMVQVRGWQQGTEVPATELAGQMASLGLKWMVYTDISRDGISRGINLDATVEVAQVSGLNVIASGGVKDWEDIRMVQAAGLSGVIVGRALYEGHLEIKNWNGI